MKTNKSSEKNIYRSKENFRWTEVDVEKNGKTTRIVVPDGKIGYGDAESQALMTGDLADKHSDDTKAGEKAYEEAREQIDTSGATTQAELKLSYLQIASVSYSISVDSPVSESISFTGHNKEWSTARTFSSTGELGYTHSGNLARRQDYSTSSSVIPSEVQGTMQNITVSFDISRREILDLGKRQGVSTPSQVNQYKLLNVPVEVTTEINTVVAEKDFSSDIDAQSFSNAPANKEIKAVVSIGGTNTIFNMGTENYLADVNRSGGDSGGGNVEASYTYKNFNTFSIS